MKDRVLNFNNWQRLNEQAESSDALITNITNNSTFGNLQPLVPAKLNDKNSKYIYATLSKPPLHDGSGQYVAFEKEKAVMLKHNNGVTIFGKDAGKLTSSKGKESDSWKSTPTGKLQYMTILHTVNDGSERGEKPVRKAEAPGAAYYSKPIAINGRFIGSLLLKDMIGKGSDNMKMFKGTSKEIVSLMPIILSTLNLAVRLGIINEMPTGKDILAQAGVSQYQSYKEQS